MENGTCIMQLHITSDTKDGLFDHRMFALENSSANPLEGEWVEKGQIKTKWESFALDATTFEHKGVRYYVWAQKILLSLAIQIFIFPKWRTLGH